MKSEIVIFILTHGRPDNVITYNTLKKMNYKEDIYIIIDNEDKTAEKYYENFGDKVVMFNKEKIAKTFDTADNFKERRTIVFARNACFEIAEKLGYKYFIEFDDDYEEFYFSFKKNMEYNSAHKRIKDFYRTLQLFLKCFKSMPIKSLAFSQGGDFIGGSNSTAWEKLILRKCMNSFICSIDRPFKFVGKINEDVNTYAGHAKTGDLFFTSALIRLKQKATQSNQGGMTDVYLDKGTYIKSFYTIIFAPSCCKIGLMGVAQMRLHHKIRWNNAVPVIIDEKYRKSQNG